MDFSKEDVLIVAQAVDDNYARWGGFDRDEGYWCMFCNPDEKGYSVDSPGDIVHNTNCEVLVARDLLTGRHD